MPPITTPRLPFRASLLKTTKTITTVPRWYATGRRSTSTPLKTNPRNTAGSALDDDVDVPMASRVPLRKPSTNGLGVPGKIPSAPPSRGASPISRSSAPSAQGSPASRSPTAGDANNTFRSRDLYVQPGRLRRVDREANEAREEGDAKAYQERYNSAARRWVSGIIAMPIFLVTSWYLFDRLALGNQPKPIPKAKKAESDD